jgi:hypothetical protein
VPLIVVTVDDDDDNNNLSNNWLRIFSTFPCQIKGRNLDAKI